MRESSGFSVAPTARLSILKARDASMPEMCASTPGWFMTKADKTCLMWELPDRAARRLQQTPDPPGIVQTNEFSGPVERRQVSGGGMKSKARLDRKRPCG